MNNQLQTYLANTYSKVIMICGPAGAGKTSLCEQYPTTYEIDSCFIKDSNFRKQLLKSKSKDFGSYIDMCSMLAWFDWDKAHSEINKLIEMVTGIANLDMYHGKFLLINAAIPGPGAILSMVDEFIYIDVPAHVRWERIVKRDSHKRDLKELMARWLLTEHAEAQYYLNLFKHHGKKIKVVDQDLNFVSNFDLNKFKEVQYVPFPV